MWTKEKSHFKSKLTVSVMCLLCCSFASSVCDRWQHHLWLHEPVIQFKFTVWCKTCFLFYLLSLFQSESVLQQCSVLWVCCVFLLQVKHYIVILSWQFDTHVKENKNYTVTEGILKGGFPSSCSLIVIERFLSKTVSGADVCCVCSYKPNSRDIVWGGCVGPHQHRRQSHRPVPAPDHRHPARPAPSQSQGSQPDSCGVQLDHQRAPCEGTTCSHTQMHTHTSLLWTCSLCYVWILYQCNS